MLLGAEQARHHRERFVPSPHDASLHASIYTWWSILDKLMIRSLRGQPMPRDARERSGEQMFVAANKYL